MNEGHERVAAMKSISASILVAFSAVEVASAGILGDVNNDGKVDYTDYALVTLYSLDLFHNMPNNGDISLGDVNNSGEVNGSDAQEILSYTLDPDSPGLPPGIGELVEVAIPAFPVCDRTAQVRDEIVQQTGRSDCAAVTDRDLSEVTDLHLGFMGIETLKVKDFDGLSALTTLVLDGNPLSELPDSVFFGLESLNTLGMGYSELTELPAGVFDGLVDLRYLDFYYNQSIEELPAGVFSDLSNLISLNLDGNALTTLPMGVFDGLVRLEELWMRQNKLEHLPFGLFSNMDRLRQIRLQGNQISELPMGLFEGLSNLREISLGNNNLTTLPDGAFRGLERLSALDLASNPGSPFALTLELERTDISDLLAAGPADITARVREGAPFDITVELEVVNGSASDQSFTVRAGETTSASVSIASAGAATAHVGWGLTGEVPGGFSGIAIGTGDPIALFAESDKQWPVAEGNIPLHVLQVGGPQPELDVESYFSDPDGSPLTYSTRPNDLVDLQTHNSTITQSPLLEGSDTVIIKATDEDGLSALQRLSIAVLPTPDPNAFNINLVFTTPTTERIRSATHRMAQRWAEIITGDLPDVDLSGYISDCQGSVGVGDHRFFGRADDLVVFVEIHPIAGGQGIGGPCAKREGSMLPYAGGFVLDTEAAAADGDGVFYTILHEIGHVLGFGTTWWDLGLVEGASEEWYFTGRRAIAAFDAAGGDQYDGNKIPLDASGGHWTGDVFGWDNPRELMIDGAGTLISAITIESFADIGYIVDLSRADPFRLPEEE